MKNYIMILTIIAFFAAMVFSVTGCGDDSTDTNTNTVSGGAHPYRILSIGASFTRDAMTYMRDILIQNGVADRDIEIVNAYIGGQTLEGHTTCAKYELKQYTRQSFGKNGAMMEVNNVTSKSIIAGNDWDLIVFQQGADRAGNLSYYKDDDIAYLINYAKQHCPNKDVKIGFHMTWAYAKNSTQTAFGDYAGDQMTMYNAIVDVVNKKIVSNNDFDIIIPSGTAIQNARTIFGDRLNSDGYHLNDLGRFIAGAMWVKEIFNLDINVFDSYQAMNDYSFDSEIIANIKKCVDDAIANPYKITDNGGGNEAQGVPLEINGSWHSTQWAETFTFDTEAKTFIKMKDEGWGEKGLITWTTTYNPNTLVCTITHNTSDGINWNVASSTAQLVWIRTYSASEDTMQINGHEYNKSNPDMGFGGMEPYRILSIGASFTRDAMRYMRDMLVENGVDSEKIAIVNAYIGGQTLKGHVDCARNDSATYTRESFGSGGAVARTYEVTSRSILESNHWDIVSFQQGAAQAGTLSAYNDDDITYLINFVKQYCPNSNVKIVFYMTWAYAQGSNQQAYINFGDQITMYNSIVDAVQTSILPKLIPDGAFECIIPAGTAFQNARTVFGDTLCGSDTYHASDLGRFIAGATWLRQLYDMGIDSFDSYKTLTITLSHDDILKIEKCVKDAYEHPFVITNQQ